MAGIGSDGRHFDRDSLHALPEEFTDFPTVHTAIGRDAAPPGWAFRLLAPDRMQQHLNPTISLEIRHG